MKIPPTTSLIICALALVGAHRIVCVVNETIAQKLEDRQWRRTIGDIRNLPTYTDPPDADYDQLPQANEEDLW